MKLIKGYFSGEYSGKHIEPMPLRSVLDLHTLHIDGGQLKGAEWVDQLPSAQGQPFVQVASIHHTDVFFDPVLHPNEKPFREDLEDCVIINPKIHTVLHQNGYTYGQIAGELYARIGMVEAIPPKPVDSHSFAPVSFPGVSLPLSIDGTSYAIGAAGSRSRSSWISWIVWGSLGLWLMWWLLSVRGCKPVDLQGRQHLQTSTDTIAVKSSNDTININGERVTFSVFDWSKEDQDTINVYINDQLIQQNIELNKNIYSWVQSDIPKGRNKLTIESVNDGKVGPASPTIEINDGWNTQIFQARVNKGKPQNFHLVIQ